MKTNLKINLKVLVVFAIILGSMFIFSMNKVDAHSVIVTNGTPTENSLDNIPDTINVDVKESEFEKVPQIIMNKITEELKKQGITTMTELEYGKDANDKYQVSVWFGNLDDEFISSMDMIYGKEKIYKVNIRINKGYSITTPIINREITINYNNTDQYNEEDRKYVENAMNKFKEETNFTIYNYIKPNEDYNYEKNLERLLNDPSITFVNTRCGENDPDNNRSTAWELVFKNGVCYQNVKFEHYTYYITENVNIGNNMSVSGLLENVSITVTPKENTEMVKVASDKSYAKILGSYELTLTGATSLVNPIDITFNVGTEYNGKMAYILHKKADGKYEEFEEKVQNGKVTITVSELSPFIVAVKENDQTPTPNPEEQEKTPTTNKGEKDDTPKTGTIDIIGYVLVTTILSGIGIVTLKKKI